MYPPLLVFLEPISNISPSMRVVSRGNNLLTREYFALFCGICCDIASIELFRNINDYKYLNILFHVGTKREIQVVRKGENPPVPETRNWENSYGEHTISLV